MFCLAWKTEKETNSCTVVLFSENPENWISHARDQTAAVMIENGLREESLLFHCNNPSHGDSDMFLGEFDINRKSNRQTQLFLHAAPEIGAKYCVTFQYPSKSSNARQNSHLKDIKYQNILLYLLKVIHYSSKVYNRIFHVETWVHT